MKHILAPLLLLAAVVRADIDETAPLPQPTPKEVRAEITALIAETKKLRLGVMEDCIEKSIGIGAPAYNNGDIEGCYNFYRITAEALVTKFSKKDMATTAAATAIVTLTKALASANGYDKADKKAWAMRYGFDKVMLRVDQLRTEAQYHMQTGTRYLGLIGNLREAEDAFRSTVQIVDELGGPNGEAVPLRLRLAAVAHGRALIGREKWKEASKAFQKALLYIPTWPTFDFDPKDFLNRPADGDAVPKALIAAVQREKDDADLRFLLGYERFFFGEREKAFECFREVLQNHPGHAGALVFQKLDPQSKLQQQISGWTAQLGDRNSKVRDAAEMALKKQGVWARPALLDALKKTNDPEVKARARALLKRLGN